MQALTQAQRLRRAARLRPHCQYFSRLGWALLTYMGVALAFSLASVPLWSAMGSAFPPSA